MKASKRLTAAATVCGIVCTAAVLRAPITSMGTLSMTVQGDLGLSATTMGLLTTLPLLAFAASALFMGVIANRFGKELVLAIGCTLVAAGILARSFLGEAGLIGGTVLMGLGISAGNVLLPAIVKDRFPLAIGAMTALYTTTMSICAGAGAGASAVLVGWQIPWRTTLALLAPAAIAGALLWAFLQRRTERGAGRLSGEHGERGGRRHSETAGATAGRAPKAAAPSTIDAAQPTTLASQAAPARRPALNLRSLLPAHIVKAPLTWWITGLFALQSTLFYCLVAWVPSILAARGIGSESISLCATLFPITGIICTVFLPPLAQRLKKQRLLGAASGVLATAGLVFLWLAQSDVAAIAAVAFLGFALGAPFCLCMFYFGARTSNAADSARLSSVAQTFGYLLAAVGPVCVGALFDATELWSAPLGLTVLLGVGLVVCGWKTGTGSVPPETV